MIPRSGGRHLAVAAVLLVVPVSSRAEPAAPPAGKAPLSAEGERRAKALSLHYRAVSLENGLRLREALDAFEELLEADPANTAAAARAAALAAALNEHDRGLATCERALRAAPDSLSAQLNLARYLHRYAPADRAGGWAARALELAEDAVDGHPGEASAVELLIDIHIGAQRGPEAEAVLERAAGLQGGDAAYWLAMGDLAARLQPPGQGPEGFLARKRIDALHEKALAAAPDELGTAERIANHHIEMRQYGRAIAILEPFAAARPGQLVLREKLARLKRIDGDPERALEIMRELVLTDPNEARTQRFLYELLTEAGESASAARHLERAVLLDGGDIDDHLDLAVLLGDDLEPPQPERALALLERGMGRFPGSARLAYMRAIVLGNLGRFADALAAYRETEELAREGAPELLDVEFHFNAGSMAERSGDSDAAEEHFARAVELVPEDEPKRAAPVLNYHGYMLLEADRDIDFAGLMVKRAVELDPGNPAYLDSLGWFYFKKQQYRRALIELRRAALLLGEAVDAEVLSHIAATYAAMGEEEKAEAYREKAAALGE